ncbi:alpha/beta fold hydrolase [Pararhizobium sp.]|uniref:alpha/beta fold hydrolase n=1 Tax=Pararhizobium sp. TaxID=1977563 RepID=UPI0027205C78|nr:alpha/beta hydrolase [Pararhizobium sp.]MDO9415543.1 alpha/beta hydrolase [Pararhizobium sp.]
MPLLTTSDGCSVYYEIRGQGDPVVLVPGLGGDGRFWDGVASELEDRYRLIILDHRGAGRSDRPIGRYRIERIAADVIEVLDAEGYATAHLVGHSTGGTIVQTLALDAPARISRLVISASWERPDARFRILFGARLALLRENLPEAYQALTHVLGYSAEWLTAHEQTLASAVTNAATTLAPLKVTAARVAMLLEFDRADELGAISHPCLIVGASDDIMIPFQHSERLAKAIPGARLASIQGGHFYPRSKPEQFASLIHEFLCRSG